MTLGQGHIDEQFTLPMGGSVRMNATDFTLEMLSPVVL